MMASCHLCSCPYQVALFSSAAKIQHRCIRARCATMFNMLPHTCMSKTVVCAALYCTQAILRPMLGDTVGTVAAVGLAQLPYWLIRSPSELLKTRQQTGQDLGSTWESLNKIRKQDGLIGLYQGYSANVVYAFPADAAKFLVYQSLKNYAK
jgi:Mitochondrial carrier protein